MPGEEIAVMIQAPVLCVGETLWDVLPTGEFLGGAPLNVAAHLVRLGTPAALVSRVGIDLRGHLALERMHELHLDTSYVQTDAQLPTGEARAMLDATGSASYDFLEPAAWDCIDAGEDVLDAARRSRAVVFGTLAQRAPASRSAIDRILGVAAGAALGAMVVAFLVLTTVRLTSYGEVTAAFAASRLSLPVAQQAEKACARWGRVLPSGPWLRQEFALASHRLQGVRSGGPSSRSQGSSR